MNIIYRVQKYTTKLPISFKKKIVEALSIIPVTKNDLFSKEKIFLTGYPKSGTTAISVLLSEALNLKVTAELKNAMYNPNDYESLYQKNLSLEKFIWNNKYDFKFPIIKECMLSFYLSELLELYPNSKFIFIVRDPRTTIRSLFNRHNIKGDITSDFEPSLSPIWSKVFDIDWMKKMKSNHIIEHCCEGWKIAYSNYLKHSDKITLIKYEDFLDNKSSVINQLIETIGYNKVSNIDSKVDIKYNITTKNKTPTDIFFSEENKTFIETSCKDELESLGYLI